MADEPKKIVPASEILEKIKREEPVEYDSVVVEGDLDLSTADLSTQQFERTEYEIAVLHFSETAKVVVSSIQIINSVISGNVFFNDCIFQNSVDFSCTLFMGSPCFSGSQFKDSTYFVRSRFFSPNFMGSRFCKHANFISSRFGESPLGEDRSESFANFRAAQFTSASFQGVKFGSADFQGSLFYESIYLNGSQFTGDILTFRNAIFADPKSQEDACRRAKNVLQRAGDREEEGYHFYREMEAKRKQKPWYIRYPEFVFVQKIFGYGVHPWWLWGWWFFFVFLFAAVYWMGEGVNDATTAQAITEPLAYIWFSITVAVTPAFAGYKPAAGWYQVVAGLEAIFGTFMWAAFITTFARMYMR